MVLFGQILIYEGNRLCISHFLKSGKFRSRLPYNNLLTKLACSSRTGEYMPSDVFVRTSLRSVGTATSSGQYSPVRPWRSVSKRLISQINTYLLILPHLLPTNTGQPACLVLSSPSPLRFRFHQNAASPCCFMVKSKISAVSEVYDASIFKLLAPFKASPFTVYFTVIMAKHRRARPNTHSRSSRLSNLYWLTFC